MCNLNPKILRRKSFTGYKAVLVDKETKKVYSPAMGCEYKVGKVKVVRKQNALCTYFSVHILNKPIMYEPLLKGRTSIFKKFADAEIVMDNMWRFYDQERYNKRIAKMKISDSLLSGTYGGPKNNVIAGKRIDSIKIKEGDKWKDYLQL